VGTGQEWMFFGGGGGDWVASHSPLGEAKHGKDCELFSRKKGKNSGQVPHCNISSLWHR